MEKEYFVSRSTIEKNSNNNVLLFLSFLILILALIVIFKPEFIVKTKQCKTLDQVKPSKEEITLVDIAQNTNRKSTIQVSNNKNPKGKDKVVKYKADYDHQYYFVSASLPYKKKAANTLAEINRRSQYLLQSIDEMLDGSSRIKAKDGTDITDNMRRLIKKHYKKKIPFSEYHNPHDKTVGSNYAKGELIEMCLRSKYDTNKWNPINTIFRVHVHELAHSADKEFRKDGNHGKVFYRLMNFLLQISENLGIYSCSEYKASGKSYCGLQLEEEDQECG